MSIIYDMITFHRHTGTTTPTPQNTLNQCSVHFAQEEQIHNISGVSVNFAVSPARSKFSGGLILGVMLPVNC